MTFCLLAILMNKIESIHYICVAKVTKKNVIRERTWIILCKTNVKRKLVSKIFILFPNNDIIFSFLPISLLTLKRIYRIRHATYSLFISSIWCFKNREEKNCGCKRLRRTLTLFSFKLLNYLFGNSTCSNFVLRMNCTIFA